MTSMASPVHSNESDGRGVTGPRMCVQYFTTRSGLGVNVMALRQDQRLRARSCAQGASLHHESAQPEHHHHRAALVANHAPSLSLISRFLLQGQSIPRISAPALAGHHSFQVHVVRRIRLLLRSRLRRWRLTSVVSATHLSWHRRRWRGICAALLVDVLGRLVWPRVYKNHDARRARLHHRVEAAVCAKLDILRLRWHYPAKRHSRQAHLLDDKPPPPARQLTHAHAERDGKSKRRCSRCAATIPNQPTAQHNIERKRHAQPHCKPVGQWRIALTQCHAHLAGFSFSKGHFAASAFSSSSFFFVSSSPSSFAPPSFPALPSSLPLLLLSPAPASVSVIAASLLPLAPSASASEAALLPRPLAVCCARRRARSCAFFVVDSTAVGSLAACSHTGLLHGWWLVMMR